MTPPAPATEDRRLFGIGLALSAYTFFTVVDTCAKWLVLSGMPPLEVVFVRYAVHLIIIVAIFAPFRGMALLRSRAYGLQVIRALCLLGSSVFNFIAVKYLALTLTASIGFAQSLLICALSVPLLGEQVGWRRWTAILVGFIGILIIVQPGTAGFHPAVFLSLLAVVCSSFYSILTRKLAPIDSAATQQFYAALVSTIAIAPFAIWGGLELPQHAVDWIPFLLVGVAGAGGHQVITVAHKFAPASTLAPFGYSQIIYMTAASWFFFQQVPTVWILIGAPIVIASGLYIWLRERELGRPVPRVTPED